ncbi:nuclear transport factor 2 family protein [Alisedimentitalea sp. MJ-SS2]|uniref:nuclear transport factor 2 family protein n=1 Tax=Aliisedimentitalea sp. MJ-SS2 TaxID=3049795 RepID=UPI00290CD392|nr:nuclear transport factor 2 family protein [Alisedimentitalea sp. MJ-SS2]MDU8925941.1 nuclear transport factor 2 family protein [Alisedimentitalea sp. MJ-SS2]
MPIVDLHVLEGYNPEEKQRLGEALTDAVRFVVPAALELVTVMIRDLPAENYYRGRSQRIPAPARPDPTQIVKDYLAAMEARELDKARAMLGDGFTMTFPGTAPMRTLEELIEWSKPRYKFVTKTYDGFDALHSAGDAAIVYCRGILQGEYHDNSPFEGIRFIDRFEIEDGKITRQDVWNDMAEVRTNA